MLFGRHIVELNATNNAVVRSYVWGLDLSVTMDGAGGVGGLLWVMLHTSSGPASGTHFTCYDGNGNIVALVSATTGDVTARYEYGPFGEPIRISGPAASLNHFRFSTKRMDSTTDLDLFEYWAYRPTTGRWPNRDPLGEFADLNLYRFNYNSPINYFDPDGLWGIAFGNSSGSSYFNIGWGDPTFYFSPESWDDIGQASQAMLEGIIPFVDPFGDNGGYDKNDPMLSLSRELGDAARDIYLGKCALIGLEFSFGKNIRVAPFGNRTKPGQSFNWRRELPHYHRRGAPGSGGQTLPGQGIGRHRPWDGSSHDATWLGRF
jgi:RHS repeat-associated protein